MSDWTKERIEVYRKLVSACKAKGIEITVDHDNLISLFDEIESLRNLEERKETGGYSTSLWSQEFIDSLREIESYSKVESMLIEHDGGTQIREIVGQHGDEYEYDSIIECKTPEAALWVAKALAFFPDALSELEKLIREKSRSERAQIIAQRHYSETEDTIKELKEKIEEAVKRLELLQGEWLPVNLSFAPAWIHKLREVVDILREQEKTDEHK